MTTTTQASTYTANDIATAKRLAGRDWTELSPDDQSIVIHLQRVHGLLDKSDGNYVGAFLEPTRSEGS